MSKTTKISFAPDDVGGGGAGAAVVSCRHHHVQTDEDPTPPTVTHNYGSRTINGYTLLDRLEKLETGQAELASVISNLTTAIVELKSELSSHKKVSSFSDACVQTRIPEKEKATENSTSLAKKEKEILELQKEVLRLHHQRSKEGGEGSSTVDFDSESPLNLFIECFKKKYDVAVHPNDVAIFV